ncbi:uncharacterized protein BDZ99DRAFT_466262 [Mytilinidion resinicola]|uniref:Uncharacterized protein n=1 Tax=Mytilinidion resinicola TaxID=574789 RepID=A0A6A6YAV6_9PEZI|nr:uncharacterized protein BDZ99DRAFT_466262 [Mytilinidion resinicola]KAF2805956.1 hypothetical protein BDZ99DRAFT_466262 [Mytilinidion resinicola]
METTILNYENQTGDGHDPFFHSICLQYLSPRPDEDLAMKPESDPSAALTVTRGTETSVSGTVGLSLSQMPSANVSLGLNRSRTLTVEYALATWSLSAHRITHVGSLRDSQAVTAPVKKEPASQERPTVPREQKLNEAEERPVYQWFWAGTHGDTKMLTPDLKQTVKRHVVVKRAVPVALFPRRKEKGERADAEVTKSDKGSVKTDDDMAAPEDDGAKKAKDDPKTAEENEKEGVYALESLLDFSFRVHVRVKKRFGRFHRVMVLSGNEVKGKLMKPVFEQNFRLRAEPSWDGVPESDTPDINALLGQIKQEYAGNYDDLEDKDFFELSNAYIVKQQRTAFQGREYDRPVYTTMTSG